MLRYGEVILLREVNKYGKNGWCLVWVWAEMQMMLHHCKVLWVAVLGVS